MYIYLKIKFQNMHNIMFNLIAQIFDIIHCTIHVFTFIDRSAYLNQNFYTYG